MNILDIAQKVFCIEANAVARLSELLTTDFEKVIENILTCQGRVVICGMGKSGLVGKKISATLASTGTPSFFLHPAEAFHGDLGMLKPEDIFIGLSNSGETEEIIRLIPSVRRNGNIIVAMAGNANSVLVKNADYFLNTNVLEEACPLRLAPTSSTTATMAMGDALAVTLMEMREFQPEDFALFHPGGSLGKKLLTKVKDKMQTQNLPIVAKNTPIKEMIFKMTEGKLGLAVVTENQRPIGIITDGDLRRAWAKHSNLLGLVAEKIMTKSPKTLQESTMLIDAEQLLTDFKITSVLVVNETEQLTGILQIYDIK